MKRPTYLVPMDFSEVSIEALHAAIGLAKYNNGSVLAIHIASKKSERDEAKATFKTILEKLQATDTELVEAKVLIGNIYDDIAKAAEIIGASLIVMGTKGAKGMQKLFGSNALRLVSSTSVPFVILQKGGELETINNIVMPFNFEKESIQIANFAGYIAKQFNATIHLVGAHDKDEWLKGKTVTNQTVIRNLFDSHQINYVISNLDNTKNYSKELLNYTDAVNADLIASSFFVDTLLPTMNSFVQELIENDRQIPILTVNAEELTVSSGLSFMTI